MPYLADPVERARALERRRLRDLEAFIEEGRRVSDVLEGWCEFCGVAMPDGPASQVCSDRCAMDYCRANRKC